MSKYGTREAELDELLRREVFVDLYTVVRQAMRVGEPGYSLKNMEAFYPLERDAEVTEAGGSILAYEEWLESRDQASSTRSPSTTQTTAARRGRCATGCWRSAATPSASFETVLPNRDAKPQRAERARS